MKRNDPDSNRILRLYRIPQLVRDALDEQVARRDWELTRSEIVRRAVKDFLREANHG